MLPAQRRTHWRTYATVGLATSVGTMARTAGAVALSLVGLQVRPARVETMSLTVCFACRVALCKKMLTSEVCRQLQLPMESVAGAMSLAFAIEVPAVLLVGSCYSMQIPWVYGGDRLP
jgi:hypothetical protein